MRISPNDPLAALAKPAVIRPKPVFDDARMARQLAELGGYSLPGDVLDRAESAAAVNTSNRREHPMQRADRTKKVRAAMYRRTKKHLDRHPLGPLFVVTLTRVAPRELDAHDNLRTALKPHVDGIASALRIDDKSPLVKWEYAQRKGEPDVEFTIEAIP